MTKKEYERYQKIGIEIDQLNQDLDDLTNEMKRLCAERKPFGNITKQIAQTIQDIGLREGIREELLLPQNVKIKGGYSEVERILREGYVCDKQVAIEEYISMYLTDNFNHNIHYFEWEVRDEDLYIAHIHWKQNQILAYDLQKLLKRDIEWISNAFIEICKDITFKGCVLIKDKRSNYIQRYPLKEAIKWLEDNYYM